MSRPRRILTTSAMVHVWNRGADRQDIVVDDLDRLRFVDLLAESTSAHRVHVHAYALMDNHFHLLLESPDGGAAPISGAMHGLESPLAREHNRRHRRTGPVFENRFGMKEVATGEQLDRTGRYVHRNPLALGRSEPLAHYRFSSLPVYAGLESAPDWLRTDRIRESFGDSPARYLEFVTTHVPSDDVCGGWPWGLADVDELVAATTAIFGCDDAAVRTRRSGWGHARLLAVTLSVELRLLHGDRLAEVFGFASPASARSAARRGRIRFESDPSFARARDHLLRQLGRSSAA